VTRFYSDSHISFGLLASLDALGHDVLKCQDTGLRDAPDHEHLWFAASERRVFVTSDHGFKLWSDAWVFWSQRWNVSHTHPGILIIPVPVKLDIASCVSSIDRYVSQDPPLANRWHELTDTGFWISPS
jgi:hypothetical protein